ncbi:uncharacterized protein LOC126362599 isoform X2 [Schistocerca gregaria]|nr:uncharacterized protein LOC126362599 isoform X2 [Schistocerca gregaria]XP_049863852.1 uncharacterized protein LOC126362599 isoform X2 [Schistocerca gregaria]
MAGTEGAGGLLHHYPYHDYQQHEAAMAEMPHNPAAHELKRCSAKLDLARERSFVRHQQREFGNRRRNAMPIRGKPTMEIYRPPNVRTDVMQNGTMPLNPRLNVHAKEFTMKHGELTTSKSSINLPSTLNSTHSHNHAHRENHRHSHYLQTSKSSGNILHSLQSSKSSGNVLHSLQQSGSSANIPQGHRVHFQLDSKAESEETSCEDMAVAQKTAQAPSDFAVKSPQKSFSVSEMKLIFPERLVPIEPSESVTSGLRDLRISAFSLKRSKSMSAADMALNRSGPGFGVAKEAPDLGNFPLEVLSNISRAVEDPNKVSTRTLMELVRIIMERVLYGVAYALPAAKLCITIIEKEKKETFLESLLNTCQQWYQERERVLKSNGASNNRYCAFIHFVNEMYCELKRRQLQLRTQYEGIPPGLVLLNLLYKGCQDCVKPPTTEGDTDCLLFVLTTAGRDLDQELPQQLQQLLAKIRDTFLTAAATPLIKKHLLQLIELHASRWQLPASAVMYYTTPQYSRSAAT